MEVWGGVSGGCPHRRAWATSPGASPGSAQRVAEGSWCPPVLHAAVPQGPGPGQFSGCAGFGGEAVSAQGGEAWGPGRCMQACRPRGGGSAGWGVRVALGIGTHQFRGLRSLLEQRKITKQRCRCGDPRQQCSAPPRCPQGACSFHSCLAPLWGPAAPSPQPPAARSSCSLHAPCAGRARPKLRAGCLSLRSWQLGPRAP